MAAAAAACSLPSCPRRAAAAGWASPDGQAAGWASPDGQGGAAMAAAGSASGLSRGQACHWTGTCRAAAAAR
eukprot:scaffold49068_cov45-Phaeocystis_antarctica.AAC.1